MAYRPLADEIRPKTLDEVVGQKHILGKDGLLRRIIEGGDIPNLIFYGPSGTGKTTVANIIAQRTNRPLQPDLLRPLGDGKDHGGQHHRPAHQPPPPPAQRHHRLYF